MIPKLFATRMRSHLARAIIPLLLAVACLYLGAPIARALERPEIAVWCAWSSWAFFGVAASHPMRLLLLPYLDLGQAVRRAIETPDGAGRVVLGVCILLSALLMMFSGSAKAELLPPLAERYLPVLLAEQREHWPSMLDPPILAGQVEQETCITLKHARCWSPHAELRTSRERGVGLGQITQTARFDALAEMRSQFPQALGAWSWADASIYDPTLQLRALVLMDLRNWRAITGAATAGDRIAMTLAAYNGGLGGLASDRAICRGTAGCDPGRWWGHTEHTSRKARATASGYGKSFFDINREYPRLITQARAPRYRAWFAERT